MYNYIYRGCQLDDNPPTPFPKRTKLCKFDVLPTRKKQYTGVEWVEISQKNFARFFGRRMFVRS